MKLTDQDKERLRVAMMVAAGEWYLETDDLALIGFHGYRRPGKDETVRKCAGIICGLIVKAGEPEPAEDNEDAQF